MASSRIPQTASQLGSEREKLLAAGLTDAEASQILFSRYGGSAQAATPATAPVAHPPMTGVASNLTAAAGYVANFVPGMFADLATMANSSMPSAARAQAVGRFVMKIIVAYVLGYVLLMEFSQFRAATARAEAEACNERSKQMINTMPGLGDHSAYARQWARRNEEFMKDCGGQE